MGYVTCARARFYMKRVASLRWKQSPGQDWHVSAAGVAARMRPPSPLRPLPATRKTFPRHSYNQRSPVGNTFCPPPWVVEAKVLPARLSTPYTSLFHFFLYIEMEVRRKEQNLDAVVQILMRSEKVNSCNELRGLCMDILIFNNLEFNLYHFDYDVITRVTIGDCVVIWSF